MNFLKLTLMKHNCVVILQKMSAAAATILCQISYKVHETYMKQCSFQKKEMHDGKQITGVSAKQTHQTKAAAATVPSRFRFKKKNIFKEMSCVSILAHESPSILRWF